MTGLVFSRLTVVKRGTKSDKTGQAYWICRCLCGTEIEVGGAELRRGNSRSCGCLQIDAVIAACTTHSGSKRPEYRHWQKMKVRCYDPKSSCFHRYGGRGITVCDRWKDDFPAFFADMGPRPTPQHSIDRYPDPDGPYEPGNVRWATSQEQNRNTSQNHIIEYQGESKPMVEWVELRGMHYSTLKHRLMIAGWSVEDALNKPVRPRRKKSDLV